jgi:nucleotide-binding universal stress UspA family protein
LWVSSPQFVLGGNMADYRRIMLAVDLTEETNRVAERAMALAKAFDAELHLVASTPWRP